ncbi:uncharacterized protein [Drosophila kikkawai]|uniref:Uncharacterized protein n=1 Tax=Drosophila kikkawai TaxID=30033 RepID=A0A6P4J5D4_DROKI|nr:uncharacterized protein LOC108079776 [Drosophila kikkawai]
MHRQRSPFTAGPGGFGASPFNFNASQFGEGTGQGFSHATDGLNGMPFMGQPSIKPMMRSISRQRQLAEDGNGLDSLPPLPIMAQRLLSSGGVMGHGRTGKAPFVPTAFAPYEGDITFLKDTPKTGSMSKPNQSLESQNFIESLRSNEEIAAKETDSESDLCIQKQGADLITESRWRRILDCVLEAIPEHRRRRWEAYSQSAIAKHMLFVLQLFVMLVRGVVVLAAPLGGVMRSCRFGIWRTKSQLRSTMRQMLWRMVNAKANDTVVFLIVVLATPWLFLVSLVGFAFSLAFSLKTGLTQGVHQMRLRLA